MSTAGVWWAPLFSLLIRSDFALPLNAVAPELTFSKTTLEGGKPLQQS